MQHIPQLADQAQFSGLPDLAQQYLRDCSKVLIFTGNGQVLFSKACQASMAELQSLQSLFGAREDALRTGILLDNKRYEVHRHHPEGPDPLVYGRTMIGDTESSEGAAVHMLSSHQAQSSIFSVVTYEMPNISARIVSQLVQFVHTAFPQR
ncbi:TPA: hypothetical protein ACH3X2_004296 [Trebouxia sp. C0005]